MFFGIFFPLILFFLKNVDSAKQSWEINEKLSSSNPAMFGDMLLTPAQIMRYQTEEQQIIVRGVSVKETVFNRWANNTIPVVISPQYSDNQKTVLKTSLKMFEKLSCFRFIDRTNERDYLFIVPLDGCYSYVGKIGGRQTVSLAVDCVADYIIWHEMMHAIGFEHEHQRPDRDSFIRVDYQNVIPGQMVNFDKLHASLVDFPDDYDYKSLMHYDGYAFGRIDTRRQIRLATMIPLKNGVKLEDNMQFTATDIEKLNRLGKCKGNYNSQKGNRMVVPDNYASNYDCIDVANNCEGNRRRGMCKNPFYQQMMINSCQKTCQLCAFRRSSNEFPSTTTPKPVKCEDTHPKCATYAENGFCTLQFYDNVRSKLCAKTCNLCQ